MIICTEYYQPGSSPEFQGSEFYWGWTTHCPHSWPLFSSPSRGKTDTIEPQNLITNHTLRPSGTKTPKQRGVSIRHNIPRVERAKLNLSLDEIKFFTTQHLSQLPGYWISYWQLQYFTGHPDTPSGLSPDDPLKPGLIPLLSTNKKEMWWTNQPDPRVEILWSEAARKRDAFVDT